VAYLLKVRIVEVEKQPWLGKALVNTFLRKRTPATMEERCYLWSLLGALLSNGAVNTFLQL
jgi:hypothetical protein